MEVPGIPPYEGQTAHPESYIDLRNAVIQARDILEQIDQDCETDPQSRYVSYGLILGLGARESRTAILTHTRSTEEFQNLPLHETYHLLLERLGLTGLRVNSPMPEEDVVYENLFYDLYPMYRQANSQRSKISMHRFSEDILAVTDMKRHFFAGRIDVSHQQKPTLLLFDLVARKASERLFLRYAKPFIDSDTHMPANSVNPVLLRSFTEPQYWRRGGSMLDYSQRNVGSNETALQWIAREHYYWDRVLIGIES